MVGDDDTKQEIQEDKVKMKGGEQEDAVIMTVEILITMTGMGIVT